MPGDNRFTARFRHTPWRLCLQLGNGKALRSSLPLALSGNCGIAAEPPVPYVVAMFLEAAPVCAGIQRQT